MNRSVWLWIIALLITLASARWQRTTGPTYELAGTVPLGGSVVHYVLERTHAGPGDHRVEIGSLPADVTGITEWKRYRSDEAWTSVPMRREGGTLAAGLPHQPPAGKLWYRVRLIRGAETVLVPAERPVAIRFRGDVPAGVLIPHILLMFLAMFLSTRAGLEAFSPRPRLRGLVTWTLASLFVGGMVIGPFVTHYAFGEWWTGFPVGNDLTDSKTLIALVGWIAAAIAVGRSKIERAWVVLAALVMLVVFAIPHSWAGGEPAYHPLDAASVPVAASADSATGLAGRDTAAKQAVAPAAAR
jgi:hypothetical protein